MPENSVLSFFLAFVLLSAVKTSAQTLDFIHLGVENGLSNKSVISITQDKRGFIWLGTADGLNRYDSRKFRTYSRGRGPSRLSSSNISCLFLDSKGTIWVGTPSSLHRYRFETDDFEMVNLPPPDSTNSGRNITCIAEDQQKRIWIGTSNGLFVLEGGKLSHFFSAGENGLPDSRVRAILAGSEGTIWVGTDNGLCRLRPETKGFHFQSYKYDAMAAGSINGAEVASIAEDEFHRIWVGLKQKGLDLYDPATEGFQHYTGPFNGGVNLTDNIRQVVADKKGRLWIATQQGLVEYDMQAKSFSLYQHDPGNTRSLSQNSLYSLFFDHDGTLWAGSYFGGVNIALPAIFTSYQNSGSHGNISNNVVSSFAPGEGKALWVGTEGGGLNYLDRQNNHVISYKHKKNDPGGISSNLVKTLYKDRAGNLWIGTSHGGGINVLPAGQHRFIKSPAMDTGKNANDEIKCFAEDDTGLLWVGAGTGLHIFRKDGILLQALPANEMPVFSEKTGNIFCLLRDSKQNMWIGTWGLFILPKGQRNIISLQKVFHNQYPGWDYPHINCITEDNAGNVWIGTDKEGLFMYNLQSGRINRYTESNGLSNNSVYSIIEDEKQLLWISTGNGLSCLDQLTGIFRNFSMADGLAGNEFNYNAYAQMPDGEIILGGFNGLTAFYPRNVPVNGGKPVAFISGLKLFDEPVYVNDAHKILRQEISLATNITLQHAQNVFTIDFVILNYVRAERNRYAYKIEGIDKNWNFTALPSATYNNLPPGEYNFAAKGANNAGVWSDPVMLHISVLPPWYRTWWAYTLYSLLVLSVIFFILRYAFLRALLKRDRQLTALKLNFFTNISHDIRTHLSLINGPVETLLLKGEGNTSADTQSLETIRQNADGLLQLVNELMDFRKAETGNLPLHAAVFNIVPFVQAVYQSFQDRSRALGIISSFIPSSERIDACFDKEQLKKVIFNLLSNAYKFTPTGGRVEVIVEEMQDTVEIRVVDNGRGISKDNLPKLFDNYFQENDYGNQNTGYGIGLALSKSIVLLHKGELTVTSEPASADGPGRTTFTVGLKKGTAHFDSSQLAALVEDRVSAHLAQELQLKENASASIANLDGSDDEKPLLLLVEDNPEVQRFIVSALASYFQIEKADNGQTGFELATEKIPDIIVSDVMMPVMNGHTLCNKLKTDERTNHIPVILLTAQTSLESQVSGLQVGADAYLTKPFSIKVLELQVSNLLASARRLRERYSRLLTPSLPDENPPGELIKQLALPAPPPAIENEFISKIIALTEAHMSDPEFDVEMICRKVAMSQSVLYKKVRAITNMTVNEIVKGVRLRKAAELLITGNYTIYEVADNVGFSDTKYFSREFKKQFGRPPNDYKKNNI